MATAHERIEYLQRRNSQLDHENYNLRYHIASAETDRRWLLGTIEALRTENDILHTHIEELQK